jgi:hypothetical protein
MRLNKGTCDKGGPLDLRWRILSPVRGNRNGDEKSMRANADGKGKGIALFTAIEDGEG